MYSCIILLSCGYGGIGRRAGFRFLWRNSYGFDPHYPYHVGAKSAPLRFKAVPFGAALKLRSAPLLLLSNSNPLRWASSWFLVHDDSLHLFYQHMTKLYCPKMQAKSTAWGCGVFYFHTSWLNHFWKWKSWNYKIELWIYRRTPFNLHLINPQYISIMHRRR